MTNPVAFNEHYCISPIRVELCPVLDKDKRYQGSTDLVVDLVSTTTSFFVYLR